MTQEPTRPTERTRGELEPPEKRNLLRSPSPDDLPNQYPDQERGDGITPEQLERLSEFASHRRGEPLQIPDWAHDLLLDDLAALLAASEQAEEDRALAGRVIDNLREIVGEAEALLGEYGAGGTPAGLIGGIHNLAHRAESAEAERDAAQERAEQAEARADRTAEGATQTVKAYKDARDFAEANANRFHEQLHEVEAELKTMKAERDTAQASEARLRKALEAVAAPLDYDSGFEADVADRLRIARDALASTPDPEDPDLWVASGGRKVKARLTPNPEARCDPFVDDWREDEEVISPTPSEARLREVVAMLRSFLRSGERLNADDEAKIDAALASTPDPEALRDADPKAERPDLVSYPVEATRQEESCPEDDDRGGAAAHAGESVTGTTRRGSAATAATSGGPNTIRSSTAPRQSPCQECDPERWKVCKVQGCPDPTPSPDADVWRGLAPPVAPRIVEKNEGGDRG